MGLPAEYGLTEKQQIYVERFVASGDPREAAEAAGYQPSDYWRLRQDPRVLHAIAVQTTQRLKDLVPVALAALSAVASNSQVAPSARVAASTAILDRAGFKPRSDDTPGGLLEDLKDMSIDKLKELVSSLETQRAAAAKDVSAPVSQPHDAQVIDMLE